MTNAPEIRRVDWNDATDTLKHIRRRVFIEEQHVPEELEWDELDAVSTHFLALFNSVPVATARLTPAGQIGRMAVLPQFRHRGIASELLQKVLLHARRQGFERVFLHAQVQVVDFYRKHGFSAQGEIFLDAGIEHRAMSLILC